MLIHRLIATTLLFVPVLALAQTQPTAPFALEKRLVMQAETLRDGAFCTKLRANRDPATLYAILTEDKSVQAA